MTEDTKHVTGEGDLTAWRDAVWEGGRDAPVRTQLLLALASPQMLDRDEWVSVVDAEPWVDATGRSMGAVVKHREYVLQSPYVEYAGQIDVETDRGTEERRSYRLVLPEEARSE